jgi:rhamnosyltransferase subunit B
VVVGLGSIFSLLADDLIADIARACADLGLRCLIVGRAPPPEMLPTGTLVVPYATYHLLFPRAVANVIHGGAGTTGEALRSGRPTVVLPMGYDQFANAWQVERLGAGVRVPRSNRSRASLSRAIDRAVSLASVARRATEVAAQLECAPDGAKRAAELIIQLRST